MCPVKTVGSPRIHMLHICIDIICLPSGKLIVRAFFATPLLTMSRPSMMKMDVVPMLAIAWFVAIVIAFKYCCVGVPKMCCAAAASVGGVWWLRVVVEMWVSADTLEVMSVMSSLSLSIDELITMGSKN